MAQSSRGRIGQLIAGLADADRMDEAEDGKPGLAIHLRGTLASVLRLACGLLSSDRPPERKKPRVARGMETQTLRNLSATISKALIMLHSYYWLLGRAQLPPPLPSLAPARSFPQAAVGKGLARIPILPHSFTPSRETIAKERNKRFG